MSLFKLFVVALLGLVLVIMGATLFISLSGSTEVSGRIRQRLVARVRELPFYRMLQRRKMNPEVFIGVTSTDELGKEVKNCEACPNSRQCDEVLSQPEDAKPDYSFCPNDPAIRALDGKTGKQGRG